MKWTTKLLPLLMVVGMAVAFLGIKNAKGTEDSNQSPLYQSTLDLAFTEMRTVRTETETESDYADHGHEYEDEGDVLGGKATHKPPEYTKCAVTHHPEAPTQCTKVTQGECQGKTICDPKKGGVTSCPRMPTDCYKRKTWCPKKETHCPKAQTWCPVIKTICPKKKEPTKCPWIKTECPKKAKKTKCPYVETACPKKRKRTKCPWKETKCPKKEDPTKCPPKNTKCPEKPKFTKCKVTHKPEALTQCDATDPTKCTAKTWCPAKETKCPPEKTKCPVKKTKCPKDPETTKCPYVKTKCPKKPDPTKCPWIPTECGPKYTECSVTHEPTAPTECGYEPTICKAATWCPKKDTQCPPEQTKCPATKTECPKKPKTTKCPYVETKCVKEPDPTKCPWIPTECGHKYTECDVTHEPTAPTECGYEPTICKAATWCPKIPGECPPESTGHDIGPTGVGVPDPTGCQNYTPIVLVYNFGTQVASFFDVFVEIELDDGTIVYEDSKPVPGPLDPGQTIEVEMVSLSLTGGHYTITAGTEWELDENSDNDEIREEFECEGPDGPAVTSYTRIEPKALALFESYPNPFSDRTRISFMIPSATHVTLRVYDVTGSVVETLIDGEKASGLYSVTWNATDTNNGIYFYRMVADGKVFTGKVALVR